MEVKITDFSSDGINKAIKRFEKIIKKSNLLKDLRESRYYRKPSEIKREKLNKAKRRKKEL